MHYTETNLYGVCVDVKLNNRCLCNTWCVAIRLCASVKSKLPHIVSMYSRHNDWQEKGHAHYTTPVSILPHLAIIPAQLLSQHLWLPIWQIFGVTWCLLPFSVVDMHDWQAKVTVTCLFCALLCAFSFVWIFSWFLKGFFPDMSFFSHLWTSLQQRHACSIDEIK